MGRELILPWEAIPDLPESVWSEGFLKLRTFGQQGQIPIKGKKLEQVKAISNAVIKYDKWVACLSASPFYLRELYATIAATWVYSRRDTVDIIDSDLLLKGVFAIEPEEKEQFRGKILNTGLLIIPYMDSNQIGVKKARGTISSLLMRRKLAKRPTIIDLQVSRKPCDGAQVSKELMYIKDILGESTLELFQDKKSKVFLVSIKEDKK